MDQSARDDPKLREVKAVLHHLQGLPSSDLPPAEPEPSQHRHGVGMPAMTMAVTAAVVVIGLGLAAIPSVWQLMTSAPQGTAVTAGPETSGKTAAKERKAAGPNSTDLAKVTIGPAAESAAPDAVENGPVTMGAATKVAVEGAVTLMNGGQVQAARKRLLQLSADGSADVLWALARSYDPTVLADIPTADASSNVPEAERWYRAWHAAAVQQGLVVVKDKSSLERLIHEMKRR
jgi:hypothetical protein